jgi:hypothetical protein
VVSIIRAIMNNVENNEIGGIGKREGLGLGKGSDLEMGEFL